MNRFGLVYLALALLTPSCAFIASKTAEPVPMDVHAMRERPKTLVVMLPGMGDDESIYRESEFFDIAGEFPESFEETSFAALDMHIGYYRDGSFIDRFKEDILDQYPDSDIHLVGASLGGFGALVLADRYTDRVSKLTLFAPYMGSPRQIRTFLETGNVQEKDSDRNKTRAIKWAWRFLLEKSQDKDVTILYGESDRVARLAPHLPKRLPHIRMKSIPGGHKWRVWKELWRLYLADEEGQ